MKTPREETRGRRSSKHKRSHMGMCAALGGKPALLGQSQLGRRWEEMRSGAEPKANSWPYRPLKGI